MVYVRRAVDARLDSVLAAAPVVALEGAKAVGKTATARQRAAQEWQLDRASDRDALRAEPTLMRHPPYPTLIDEWQRLPESWDEARRWVDDGAPPGALILTGSATLPTGVDTHSGSGRVLGVRMRPMGLFERGLAPSVSMSDLLAGSPQISGTTDITLPAYAAHITSGGFPGIRAADPQVREDLLETYTRNIVERDLREADVVVRAPQTLRRWLAAYAAASSTTTAYNRLLSAAVGPEGEQPAKTTTIAYREHLERIYVLDPVPAWSPSLNPFAALQVGPKHQLVDPAIAARLLGITEGSLTTERGRHMLGPLFESLATLTVRVAAESARARVGHLRTRDGRHEVDLIVEGRDGQIVGIEVKLSREVRDDDVRHLVWLREQCADVVDLVVLTTGPRAYRRMDGVAVVPLALLGA